MSGGLEMGLGEGLGFGVQKSQTIITSYIATVQLIGAEVCIAMPGVLYSCTYIYLFIA